jgi:SAM-dependent methyltransferase
MERSDDENLFFAENLSAVDQLNGRFYKKFPYPWPPAVFERVADPVLETTLLNQSIGNWDRYDIPRNSNVWVAGCGTNQAVITALKFPNAAITATDLSSSSLEMAQHSARQLGLTNITFRQQSINESNERDEFDYILCTGVIHHNADPAAPLRKMRTALRRKGVCELMVYNRYHRILTTAFQKAVQILAQTESGTEFEREIQVARAVLRSKLTGNMGLFAASMQSEPEVVIADACMQPVEHSYTVESLEQLVASCGFEIAAPCINQYNKASGGFLWHVSFDDPDVKHAYEALPDSRRWQLANLLLLENSPLLWFYLQRDDSNRAVKSEKHLCEEFLERRFITVKTRKRVYIRQEAARYVEDQRMHGYPTPHTDPLCARILAELERQRGASMRSIFRGLKLSLEFPDVNKVRLMLTTCSFPYLISPEMASAQ